MDENYLNIKASSQFCNMSDDDMINIILDLNAFYLFKTEYIQSRLRKIALSLKLKRTNNHSINT